MHKKKVKSSFAPDLDLFLLPEINTIIYLSLIPRHCSPNQINQFFPFNIIITLISECKGMKFFPFVQEFLLHKVCELYHATLFTIAQQSKTTIQHSAFYVAYLQNVPAHNIQMGIKESQRFLFRKNTKIRFPTIFFEKNVYVFFTTLPLGGIFNVSSMNSYMVNSKLFLTDNNYQSYQSSTSNYHFLLEKDW